MAPDQRLAVRRQVELARRLAEASITFVEQQLGQSTLRPPTGKTLLRRLSRHRDGLDQLAGVLAALEADLDSEQPPTPD